MNKIKNIKNEKSGNTILHSVEEVIKRYFPEDVQKDEPLPGTMGKRIANRSLGRILTEMKKVKK